MRGHRNALSAERLLETAACLTKTSPAAIDELGSTLLASSARDSGSGGGRSALNHDGSWLQLCLSSSQSGWRTRLVGDPAASEPDPVRRLDAGRAALERLLELRNAGQLHEICDRTLALTVPRTPQALQDYRFGVMWIASAVEDPGAAFYVDAHPAGEAGGWQVARAWLEEILDRHGAADDIIDRLSDHARVASFGIEGTGPQDARAKIYFRLKQPMPLAELGIDLLTGHALTQFLTMAMKDFAVDLEGLVLCVGFDVAGGGLVDAKIDLCGHCLRYSKDDWQSLVTRCTETFDLAPLPVSDVLAQDQEVAFLGFGVDQRGRHRLNLYVKATMPEGPPTADEIHAAIGDAVGHLVSLQSEAGSWTDYALPVGASDQWVTAYVAHALTYAAGVTKGRDAVGACGRAADWLLDNRTYEAGWGYNGITGPDTDSTAFAVALFDRLGRRVTPADRAFLRTRWLPSGGFATFDGPGAWGVAHPDVTPMAFLGLAPADRAALQPALIDYLSRTQQDNGLWPAYWWRHPFYGSFLTLLAMRELGMDEAAMAPPSRNTRFEISTAFDLAGVIGIECMRDAAGDRLLGLVRRLLAMQEPDGGWPGSESLRVTDDACYEPWNAPAGDYYVDLSGTITTATAILTLSQVLDPPHSRSRANGTGP